jgi:hypothetical protein
LGRTSFPAQNGRGFELKLRLSAMLGVSMPIKGHRIASHRIASHRIASQARIDN